MATTQRWVMSALTCHSGGRAAGSAQRHLLFNHLVDIQSWADYCLYNQLVEYGGDGCQKISYRGSLRHWLIRPGGTWSRGWQWVTPRWANSPSRMESRSRPFRSICACWKT